MPKLQGNSHFQIFTSIFAAVRPNRQAKVESRRAPFKCDDSGSQELDTGLPRLVRCHAFTPLGGAVWCWMHRAPLMLYLTCCTVLDLVIGRTTAFETIVSSAAAR